MSKRAIIIGAGPAGLTAALELLRRTDIKPIVLEASGEIGGISRTIRYKGNRMDIGGHRFFSKSDRVMEWWIDLMPPVPEGVAQETEGPAVISYRGKQRVVEIPVAQPEEPPLRGMGPLEKHEAEEEEEAAETPHIETVVTHEPESPELVMLIRPRRSRIYYLRRFFDYPITLTATTLGNLGAARTVKVGLSYLKSRVTQIRPDRKSVV